MDNPYNLLRNLINDPADLVEIEVFGYSDPKNIGSGEPGISNVITFEGTDNFKLNGKDLSTEELLQQINLTKFGYIVKIARITIDDFDPDPVFVTDYVYNCDNKNSSVYKDYITGCAVKIQRGYRKKKITDATPPYGKDYLKLLDRYRYWDIGSTGSTGNTGNNFGKNKNCLNTINKLIEYVKKC